MMKKSCTVLSLLFLLNFAGCTKEEILDPGSDGIDLNGNWTAKGYTCPGGTSIPTETVGIVQSQGKITATKVTGDPCVPAGKVTFTGIYDESKKIYNLTWTTGSSSAPASSTASGTMTVVDKNHLESTFSGNPSVSFTR